MQAITTKFLSATNHKGARVKATCQAGSLTVSWDHALNMDENYDAAARALATKLGWAGEWARGWLPARVGCCYVLLPAASFTVVVAS